VREGEGEVTKDPACAWVLATLQDNSEPCHIIFLRVAIACSSGYMPWPDTRLAAALHKLEEAGYIRSYDGEYYILWAHASSCKCA